MNPILIRKIEELGGISRKSISKEINEKDLKFINSKILNIFHKELPESYIDFIRHFGTFTFKKEVRAKLIEKNSFSNINNAVVVDFFYPINDDKEEGIFSLIEQYHNQIPFGLLPISDGLSGDLICISLNENNYGCIYYWFHEGSIGKDTFYIAHDFDTFILNLYNETEQDGIEYYSEDAQINLTPELQAMLNKSGHGPK